MRAGAATVGNSEVASFSPQTVVHDRSLASTTSGATGRSSVSSPSACTSKLDLKVGFRFAARRTRAPPSTCRPSAFRPVEPGTEPVGDFYAVAGVIQDIVESADFGTISTPKVAIAYRPTDDVFLYASYAEGYTSSLS